MENIIKELLSDKRYVHCCGVASLSKKLAREIGADEEKAYFAGMVHDIAKEKSLDEMLRLCKEHNVSADGMEKSSAALLHAAAGVAMLEEYGVSDKEILNAVRYHTVGRAEMSQLEKIVYLADMIEPSRNYDGVEVLRNSLKSGFDEAFKNALRCSVIWNMQKGKAVHSGTLYAWNELMERK